MVIPEMTNQSKTLPQAPHEAGLEQARLAACTENGLDNMIASIEVSVESFPYLMDHAFQGMIVLPGTFFLDLALQISKGRLGESARRIRRTVFHRPVILSESGVRLDVTCHHLSEHTLNCTFSEASTGPADGSSRLLCADCEVECGACHESGALTSGFEASDFRGKADEVENGRAYYDRLRRNGNEYGPQFQHLQQVWLGGRDALGRLSRSSASAPVENHLLDPVMLDCAMQLLAAFAIDSGKTFVLRGVDEVTPARVALPNECWVHATLRSDAGSGDPLSLGDVEILDDSGGCLLRLTGVRFSHLDQAAEPQVVDQPPCEIAITANFTAEPVEDSLRFWSGYLTVPVRTTFAPYNQVFQELLSSDSLLKRNRDGFNVLLLNLEDWASESPSGRSAALTKMRKEDLAGCERYTLPNGLEIGHLNRYETDYLYHEIFENQCYLRHGIRLPEGATVLDIGANIGLFSLFVGLQCPTATVYSFEPSPPAFAVLQANCRAHSPNLHPFNLGVSDSSGSAELTFYGHSSVFSGFHPDPTEDRQAVEIIARQLVQKELQGGTEPVDDYVRELTADRLEAKTFQCRLVSVSEIIRTNGLKRVDLLKVDAEKSELEILRGIDDEHWQLIDQVVVEVHDRSRDVVGQVEEILREKGFQCAVDEEALLAGSGLFNVYGMRRDTIGAEADDRAASPARPNRLQSRVDELVLALEAFLKTANCPTVLCICPSTDCTDREILRKAEKDLLARIRSSSGLYAISSEKILARYPTHPFHDSHGRELGHIPYTAEGFAAIGTSLFRTWMALRRPPFKVVVLDCDNTLWEGACGEDGPLGVVVTPGHRALQEFMVRQANAGMLLCLCSKNNEADVWAVFDRNPAMVLDRKHIASWRINWQPKSANLRALAQELHLGLDSFIFLDDDPLECAEVQRGCPGVVTLQTPRDSSQLASFLDHAWIFDRWSVTEEDTKRNQMVQEQHQREDYRSRVPTLKEFIDGLELKIIFSEASAEQLSRLSQLTVRTNQLNFTAVRRSEREIADYLEDECHKGMAIRVTDRFGDYGLVGLALFEIGSDHFGMDTFLLSCRALGRGVEHRFLAETGRRAIEAGKNWIELNFIPTDRNQVAWNFLSSLPVQPAAADNGILRFRLPAEVAASLRYDPESAQTTSPGPASDGRAEGPSVRPCSLQNVRPVSEEQVERIARELATVKEISLAVERFKLESSNECIDNSLRPPETLEERLLQIWRRILANPKLGVNDNFFDVGGTSLKAVLTVAAVRKELNATLSLVGLFENPTVRKLTNALRPNPQEDGRVAAIIERGQRRKRRPEVRRSSRT
nr:putative NRPS/PKS hybrid synthase module E2A [uncultured bacterium]